MRYKYKLVYKLKELQNKYNVKVLYPKTKYKDLQKIINDIFKLTVFLDNKHSTFNKLSTRVFFLENNLKNIPKCEQCKEKEVNTFMSRFCSGSCQKRHFDLNESEEDKLKRVTKAAESRNYEEILRKQWETRHSDKEKHEEFLKKAKESANKMTDSGMTVAQERAIKISKTKNTIESNGLTNAQNTGIKISISKKLNYTPDKNHWNLIDEVEKEKRLKKQYKSMRKTNESNGRWRTFEDLEDYEIYFKASSFKHGFNTTNENEIKLLNEYGIFNNLTNTKGCVRDHLLSRRYGFENNIPTWIISHPANCEIVLHSENIRRSSTNDNLITLDELLERIENWK